MTWQASADETALLFNEPPDPELIALLNKVLSLELTSMMSYRNRVIAMAGSKNRDLTRRFLNYSRQDKRNASRLASRIVRLGGQLDQNLRAIAERSQASSDGEFRSLLRQSLRSEGRTAERYVELRREVPASDLESARLLAAIHQSKKSRARELTETLAQLGA